MTKQEVLKRFSKKPYLLEMGAGKLSKWFGVSVDVIKECKSLIRGYNIKYVDAKDVVYKKTGLKILIIDIETSPMKAYIWKRWKENISLPQTISEWFMLSWSAKWLDGDLHSDVLTSEEVLSEDDKRITNNLLILLNEADVVIAHNGDRFDLPKINTRALLNNFGPIKPFQTIDTLKVAKQQFGFSSNKLDALAIFFGLDCKLHTDFDLWKRCMNGDETALSYMLEYNNYDVVLLEKIYKKLKPWIKNHPNEGHFSEEAVCPTCGSTHIKYNSNYYTNAGRYKLYKCDDCGALSKTRKSEKTNIKLTSNIR